MFRAHAPLQAACENLGSALKLLANLQAGGDDFVHDLRGFAGAEQNHE